MSEPFILFQVAGTTYAVPSAQVQQVEMVGNITRVPNALEFIEGVTSIRGRIIPVIHLRRRFHVDMVPFDLRTRLLVILLDHRQVGLIVDAAREMVQLERENILPPPEGLTGPGTEYLDGVVTLDDRLILVMDLPNLLSSSERQALADQPPAVEE